MKVVENSLVTVWSPDFLEKDEAGLAVTEKVGEVVLVPPKALNVEGDH